MPDVGVIMGSDSDYDVMSAAVEALREFDVEHEVRVVSAHRTPIGMTEYAQAAAGRGPKVSIAIREPQTRIMAGVRQPVRDFAVMENFLAFAKEPGRGRFGFFRNLPASRASP